MKRFFIIGCVLLAMFTAYLKYDSFKYNYMHNETVESAYTLKDVGLDDR